MSNPFEIPATDEQLPPGDGLESRSVSFPSGKTVTYEALMDCPLKLDEHTRAPIPVATVRDYFRATLLKFLDDPEDFSGKRPFGSSWWHGPIASAWVRHGLVEGRLDPDEGWLEDYEREQFDSCMELVTHWILK